mmetsp:Transcript_5947/g.9102  ORF Transcript_5947/g.9102 Transcript_5947/m.9102 type:complete len:170 (+) Transcript_5947:67-576(+)
MGSCALRTISFFLIVCNVVSFSSPIRAGTQTLVGGRASILRTRAHGLDDVDRNHHGNRRALLRSVGASILSTAAFLSQKNQAGAADAGAIRWISGKTPKIPGEKPKESKDTAGTRKDPGFLRSVSDCKSKCETLLMTTGSSKPKEDCLSECQDICCTTYEQCTFAIVPR